MRNLYEILKDMCGVIEKEMESATSKLMKADGNMTGDDLSYLDKLTHTLKSIKTTMAMTGEGEYSGAYPYADNMVGGMRSYRMDGGSYGSYAGRRNARRDSMGRYSREGGSYDGGYSMGNEDFRTEMQELMQAAPNNQIRQKLQRIVSEM